MLPSDRRAPSKGIGSSWVARTGGGRMCYFGLDVGRHGKRHVDLGEVNASPQPWRPVGHGRRHQLQLDGGMGLAGVGDHLQGH